MGHSHYAYDRFDADKNNLTRPLYGYVTKFKEGNVPSWVVSPKMSANDLVRLFRLDGDYGYDDKIPRRKLPDGVSRDMGGVHDPVRYEINPQAYLEQQQTLCSELPNDHYMNPSTVTFELNMKGSGVIVSHARRGATVPDEITERLSAIQNTPEWDRKIDGYHNSFREWELEYQLGNRGGITDVRITADIHH